MCNPRPRKGSIEKSTLPLGRIPIDSTRVPQPVKSYDEQDSDYNHGSIFDPLEYEPRPMRDESNVEADTVPSETTVSVKKYLKVDKDGKNRTVAIVQHNYHDHSEDNSVQHRHKVRKSRGGVAIPFPLKLHDMLEKTMAEGYGDIVSWQPHGRSFVVHKPQEFQEIVLPKYYKLTKLSSFQRQLNLYGYQRLTLGRDRGCYYHELFLRNKKFLARNMARVQVKGTGVRARSNPDQEPNFWTMKWCGFKAPAVSSDDDSERGGSVNCKRKRKMTVNPFLPREQGSSPSTSGTGPFSGQISIQGQIHPVQRMIPPMGFNQTVTSYNVAPKEQSLFRMNWNTEDEDLVSSFGNHTFHYLDLSQPLPVNKNRTQKRNEVGRNDYAEIANLLS